MLDLPSLAGIALRTSLLILAAGLLSVVLRRQAAALRHLVWTSTLALCALMPIAVLLLPSYSILTIHLDTAALIPSSGRGGGGPGLGQASGPVLITLWMLGISIILARELLMNIRLVHWQRRARPLESASWRRTLSRLAPPSGFDARVRVLESKQIASPCMWGVLRPVLLLPSAGDGWPESARRSALLHELAHVRRRDALSTFVSRLACAIHWYNPLVWLAAARVRNLQEHACDDEVLRAGAIPTEYAQFLVDVAAHMSGISASTRTAIGMAHGSSLRTRIVAILDPDAAREQPQRTPAVATCASLLGAMIFLATATVASQTEVPASDDPPAADPAAPILTTPAIPEIPEIPAIPTIPSIPATPAIPAVPAIPADPPAPPTD